MFVIDTLTKRRALRNWLVLQSVSNESHGSDNLVSYFEIGGKIVECATYQADANQPGFGKPMDELGKMILEKTVIELADAAVGDRYSVKRGISGTQKIRAGGSAVSTGGAIARWALVAAAADGPLPIGDIVAAGILIGGGAYLIHQGYQDVRQK